MDIFHLLTQILLLNLEKNFFTLDAPHIGLASSVVEVFTHGSGSHHQLRKLNTRLELIQSGTCKSGGGYIHQSTKLLKEIKFFHVQTTTVDQVRVAQV